MLTPQEVQEKTFDKAVFGGYDMQAVDTFLDPLTKDYETLYNENVVLKSKLRVLVNKLTELRDESNKIQQEQDQTRKACEDMLRETKEKCDAMMADAKIAAISQDDLEAQETMRLHYARELAHSYIEALEHDMQSHLELLQSLKERDLAAEVEATRMTQERAASKGDDTRAIADEIEKNLVMQGITEAPVEEEAPAEEAAPVEEAAPAEKSAVPQTTIKFENLKFGTNYNPRGK